MNRLHFAVPTLLLLATPLLAQEGPPGPGPEHKQLQRFVGTWDVIVKSYGAPGEEAMTMTGVDETTSVSNGMWLLTKVTGQSMPFTGAGLTGWDAIKNQYVSVWVDSTTAAPSTSQGSFDAKTSMFAMTGTLSTPMGAMKTRSEISFPDADTHIEKTWMIGADGKETLGMELSFRRHKGDGKPAPAAASKDAEPMAMPDPKTKSHSRLQQYAGTWNAIVSMSMAPGMPESKSPMTQTDELLCGDLWVHTCAKGEFAGMPFEGHGLLGYDPKEKQFVSFWVDNFAPFLMQSRGSCDDGGKVFTLTGESLDMNGKPCTSHETTTFADADHRTLEMKSTAKDGSDAGGMKIEYTRKK